jgi:hypothetical protein
MGRSVPRAPSRDGGIVAVPPLHEAGVLVTSNRQRLPHQGGLLGRPWTELRRDARRAAVAAALRYLGESSEIDVDSLLVAGHQPELFHPGVWVKNFALCGMARALQATSLNLVIDNDTVKTTALIAPDPPHLRRLPFDRWTGETPYEERTIADRTAFADFAERAGAWLRAWPYEPLLPAFWAEAMRQSERTANLGECFAAARRRFERAWGCHNLEVPLSAVCNTEPFAWFAGHLLSHLPHFHSLYNTIVADYRRRYGIRDDRHPVPDLAVEGDWLEAPFWIWRSGAARRGRLFARRVGDSLNLRYGDETWQLNANPPALIEEWHKLESDGIKIRSRALTTTLYARVFLADLFIHGIGGGKYDELTDELIRRFYGCEPPGYLVLSATLWLPLPRFDVSIDDYRRLRREQRDLHYNPQRYVSVLEPSEDFTALAVRKSEWIARQPATAAQRRERFHALRMLTEQLRLTLQWREEQLRQQLLLCQRQLRDNAVLQRRDYSFCFYPENTLRPFCTQFLDERMYRSESAG